MSASLEVVEVQPPLLAGTLEPVAAICQRVTGRRPSPPTIWRWCNRGTCGSGRLPHVRVFGRPHTTERAFRSWLHGELAPAAAPAVDVTDAALEAAGLL